MIDLAFAAFLSLVCLGTGKRILDRFGQAPEHPLDAVALAMPLGMGLMALGTLALGELGWLTRRGLAGLLALLIGQGLLPAFRLLGAVGDRARTILGSGRTHWSATDRV